MDVKIDTKEKFTVITPEQAQISANMTAGLQKLLLSYLNKDIPHIILNLKHVTDMDEMALDLIAGIHTQFYEHNASFIVCELQKGIENLFIDKNILDLLNVTPTESEAWDIAQMEEIERELMKDFDNNTEY